MSRPRMISTIARCAISTSPGADPQGRTGQSTAGATHLIKVAVEAALGKRESVSVFGTDYDTNDGTGVRDYIHVSDLAAAHVIALQAH
jgi:UDP-glucose 4-epimerase